MNQPTYLTNPRKKQKVKEEEEEEESKKERPMKFGKRLQLEMEPGWEQHYVPYKELKRQLKRLRDNIGMLDALEESALWVPVRGCLDRIRDFVVGQVQQAHEALGAATRNTNTNTNTSSSLFSSTASAASAAAQSHMHILTWAAVCLHTDRLQHLIHLNHLALVKIVKKRNRNLTPLGAPPLALAPLLVSCDVFRSPELYRLWGRLDRMAHRLRSSLGPVGFALGLRTWGLANGATNAANSPTNTATPICPMCLHAARPAVWLRCRHHVCVDCLHHALPTSSPACPVCRTPLPLDDPTAVRIDRTLAECARRCLPPPLAPLHLHVAISRLLTYTSPSPPPPSSSAHSSAARTGTTLASAMSSFAVVDPSSSSTATATASATATRTTDISAIAATSTAFVSSRKRLLWIQSRAVCDMAHPTSGQSVQIPPGCDLFVPNTGLCVSQLIKSLSSAFCPVVVAADPVWIDFYRTAASKVVFDENDLDNDHGCKNVKVALNPYNSDVESVSRIAKKWDQTRSQEMPPVWIVHWGDPRLAPDRTVDLINIYRKRQRHFPEEDWLVVVSYTPNERSLNPRSEIAQGSVLPTHPQGQQKLLGKSASHSAKKTIRSVLDDIGLKEDVLIPTHQIAPFDELSPIDNTTGFFHGFEPVCEKSPSLSPIQNGHTKTSTSASKLDNECHQGAAPNSALDDSNCAREIPPSFNSKAPDESYNPRYGQVSLYGDAVLALPVNKQNLNSEVMADWIRFHILPESHDVYSYMQKPRHMLCPPRPGMPKQSPQNEMEVFSFEL